MGAGFVGGVKAILCNGKDVGKELRRVFGTPGSNDYIAAQARQDSFLKVANGPGDAAALYKAYTDAGVKACDSWNYYLGTLTAADIKKIAQARYLGLSTDVPMKTGTHDAQNGGDHDVHVSSDLEDGTITIDSPFTPGP
jgi:hypothetical protein